MNNSEILKLLAQRTGLTLKETKQLFKQTVGVFSETLGNYVGFSIPDLGTFGTHIREARQAYDLNRKAHVQLPPKRLVSFSPAVGLKEEIKEIGVKPPALRPSTDAPKEAAPATEASLKDQAAAPENTRESLRRELQAPGGDSPYRLRRGPTGSPEQAEETAEQTTDDVPTPPEEVAIKEAAQPEAPPPEPASDEEQQPESSATVPDTTITEPVEAPQPSSQSDQASPQPPDSDEPRPGGESPEPEKQP